MNSLEIIKSQLQSMVPLFEQTAIDCFERMFQKRTNSVTPWTVVDHLNVEYKNLITMGTANNEYRSLILAGIGDDTVREFLDDDSLDMEYLADVLGEFVNSYCALLDDNELYASIFGKQIQAVPMLYSGGYPFVSSLWGIQGKLHIGEGELYVGYVIQQSTTDEQVGDCHE